MKWNIFNESTNKDKDENTYDHVQDLLVDIKDEFQVKIHHETFRHKKIQRFLIDIYLGFAIQDIKDDKESLEDINNSIRNTKRLSDCWDLINQFLLRLDVDYKFTILVIEDDFWIDFIRIDLRVPIS